MKTAMPETFAKRHGYRAVDADVTVREDAPAELRAAVPQIALRAGMTYASMREVICRTLLAQPDPANRSEIPHIRDEVDGLLRNCKWFKVYDAAEALCAAAEPARRRQFADLLNGFFRENGIGWEMREGRIVFRGSKPFRETTWETVRMLEETNRPRAANEMRKAVLELSRRPAPDVLAAMLCVTEALQATAQDLTGQYKPDMDRLIPALDLPQPLASVVEKLWAYASDRARCKDCIPDAAEAELTVSIAGALCKFLAERGGGPPGSTPIREGYNRSADFRKLWGAWPGDEPIEELLKQID